MSEENKLLKFLRLATPEQRQRCAEIAKTSVNYLYQIASGGKSKRGPNLILAVGIERGTYALHVETDGKLPVVTPHDLVQISGE